MAEIGGKVMTFDQLAQHIGPDGEFIEVIELLGKSVPIFDKLGLKASNQLTSHVVGQRRGLPTTTRRRMNQGVAPSRGTVDQVTEAITMYANRSTLDKRMADIAGDDVAIARERLNNGEGHIMSLAQMANKDIWTASTDDDSTQYYGMQYRYNSTTGDTGDNVLLAGGSGSDNCSFYLVGHGPTYAVYPKNYMGGVDHIDHGVQQVPDGTGVEGALLTAYVDEWCLDLGLVVSDWRHNVRIANVDVYDILNVANTQTLTSYGTNMLFLMAEAHHHLPYGGRMCDPEWYMPPSAAIAFDRQALARTTDNVFKTEQVDGVSKITFRGVSVAVDDTLGYNETAIS